MIEELRVSDSAILGSQDNYDVLKEAVEKLSKASQDQFEIIKKERWYNRVFDMVTFSHKREIRLAEQITTVAQAQQVLIELLLRLSVNDANISQIVCDSLEDIRKIQEQNIYLLSKIKHLEILTLGIKPEMDISKLTEFEKKVLSACLYKLSSRNVESSEEQKQYANAVLSYVGTDTQMENPIGALDEMDIASKKQILSCCLEYIFLRNCENDSFYDFEDFIDEFDLGNKTVKSIKSQIFALYDLRGCDGFYSKYTKDYYEDISDEFSIEIDQQEDDKDEEEKELADYVIISPLVISEKEEIVFQSKNIHIGADLVCKGKVSFENCVIHCKEENFGGKICVKGGNLKAVNSTFVMATHDGEYFIEGTSEGSLEANLEFESCKFNDCGYFIGFSDTNGKLIINNSEIINPNICFLRGRVRKYTISNCTFELKEKNKFVDQSKHEYQVIGLFNEQCFDSQDSYGIFRDNKVYIKIPSFEIKGEEYEHMIFLNYATHVSNCLFVGGKVFYRTINAEFVEKCTFVDDKDAVLSKQIEECTFEKCIDPVTLGTGSWMDIDDCTLNLKKSVFDGCSNRWIKFVNYPKRVIISNTVFKNMVDREEPFSQEEKDLISFMTFSACIMFASFKDTEQLLIEKCSFENIDLKGWFLISNKVVEKIKQNVCRVVDCNFRNVVSDRKDGVIVKTKDRYFGLFNREIEVTSVQIVNCTGL